MNALERQRDAIARIGGILLTPEKINSLTPPELDGIDLITFLYKLGAPFQVSFNLDYYEWPPEKKQRLLAALTNPRVLVPFNRFQLARRVITDPWKDSVLWRKGIGIEGHLLGLKREEIFRKLGYYEYLIKELVKDHDERLQHYSLYAERFMPMLKKFINNPASPISPYFAFFMYEVFGIILQDARHERERLQREGVQANIDYQQILKQAAEAKRLSEPLLILKQGQIISEQLMGGEIFIGFPPPPQQDPKFDERKTDSRQYFPFLTEVGRFAHPMLGILNGLSEGLSLPNYHQPSLLAVIGLKKKFEKKN